MEDNSLKTVFSFKLFGTEVKGVRDEEKQADFYNDVVFPDFLGTGINITETIFNTWILITIVFTFCIITRIAMRKFKDVPKGFQNCIEGIIELFRNFVASTMGAHNLKFAPFYLGLFLFIMLSNLSGLFALRPPTADFATTFALAIITFCMIQGFNVGKNGIKSYIKGFFEPIFLLFPINVIGELATPISLSFRLFGNILGGTIIMSLFYSMPWLLVKFGVPAVLHAYFDLFAGILQAFIFVMLSMTFVSNVIPVPETKTENE